MFDVATSLRPGLRSADAALDTASRALAHANAGDTDALNRAMSASAQAALFSEVLMNAVHARFGEIKAAAK